MINIIFISFVLLTGLRVWFIEARHDYEVIKMKVPGAQSNWKIFGNINEMTQLAVLVFLLGVFMGTAYLMLFPVLVFVWWIVHDLAMGYYLTGNIFHIGSSGFDLFAARIFQMSGVLYFSFKMFWLTILTGIYFAL